MATMDSDLYDALVSAGAPEDKARAAAISYAEGHLATREDIARIERDLTVVKWMIGLVLAAQVVPLLRSLGL